MDARADDHASGFAISVPAWRARRLRAHLAALFEAGAAAAGSGDAEPPADLAHRAEIRRWRAGRASGGAAAKAAAPAPTARQLARIERWRGGVGRLRPAEGDLRRSILDEVADELLGARPLAHGAIAAAHRETVRRCREVGLPAPKASRYRRWLKLSRGI